MNYVNHVNHDLAVQSGWSIAHVAAAHYDAGNEC
jgi:hypothetical protein